MAILTIIEALKVEVIIGDQALPEHIDESEPPDDPNHIVVFVEIAEPSYFGVRCNLPKGFSRDLNDVQQSISVDGGKSSIRNLDKQVCEKGDHTTLIDRVSYTEHGEAESGRLKFAPLDIVEQVQGLRKEDLPKFKGLGEIVITLHRVRKVARREQPALPWQNSKKTLSESSVPEKGLEWRALSHGVRFEESPARPKPPPRFDYYHTETDAFASVVFRYRSRDDLIKSGVVERLRTPDEVDSMTIEQLSEVARAHRDQSSAIVETDAARRLKCERSVEAAEQWEKRMCLAAETIDLTGAWQLGWMCSPLPSSGVSGHQGKA